MVDDTIEPDYQHRFIVEDFKAYIRNRKVFDGGCWTGPLEKEIVRQGLNAEVVAFDENSDALNVARKNLPSCGFICGNLLEPPLELRKDYKNYFDTVFFMDVMEHLPRSKETGALKLFNHLLKPEGSLILSTMADHIFNFIDPAWFSGHRHYTLKDIVKILDATGFKLEIVKKIGNLYWDVDLLFFYFYKHVLKKKYQRSPAMLKKIDEGFKNPVIATRLYLVAKKIS
jgi:2-polyprenyl-3-methyl-5-hydroxy-6-metoxy-1,4-benzoquinol methylase